MNTDTYVVAEISGQRVALAATAVEAIVDIGAIAPIPCAPDHIAGLCALRSAVLTIVDIVPATPRDANIVRRRAAVVQHEGHRYAIRLDDIEDVEAIGARPQPTDASIGSDWLAMAPARIETARGMALLLDIGQVIAGGGNAARN